MEIAFIEFGAADPQLTQPGRGGARFARESERSESKFEMHGNLARDLVPNTPSAVPQEEAEE